MAFCVNCGAQLGEGAAFCPGCGVSIGGPQVAPQTQTPYQAEPQPQIAYQAAPQPQNPYQTTPQPQATYQAESHSQPQNPYQPQSPYQAAPQAQSAPMPGHAAASDPDVEQNKWLAALSYIHLLVLITWFVAPNSKFARQHAKEGVKLCFIWVSASILTFLLGLIKVRHDLVYTYYYSTPWIITTFNGLLMLGIAVLAVIGITNALSGREARSLPVIDKIPFDKIPVIKDIIK